MNEPENEGQVAAEVKSRQFRLFDFFRAVLWFWPFEDRSADWQIIRRLTIVVSVGVGLAGGAGVLVSELQKLRFDKELFEATTATTADGIGKNVAVMDYASAAFLADAYHKFVQVRALQITDRYGFLIYGPAEIDMKDYPSNTVLVERKLYADPAAQEAGGEVVGLLREVVASPSVGSILFDVTWKGLAVGFIFGSLVAGTMRFYMRTFVIEPLERFTEAVSTTSETGKHTRVEYLSETKFGILARRFNQMQDRLEAQDQTQQSLIDQNMKVNDDLRRAYDQIRKEQQVKLAQFVALANVLYEAEIILAYFDTNGDQVFSNADRHPVAAIAAVIRRGRFDANSIIDRLSADGLTCRVVGVEAVDAAARQGGFEIEVLAQDGRTWVIVVGPRDVEGQVVLCTNISNLREMEQKLRQKQKMEALGRLVGGVAHEFNNMLAIIFGNLELLEMSDLGKGSVRQTYLEGAKRASERAAATVSQLLTFARARPVPHNNTEVDSQILGLAAMIRGTLHPGTELMTEIEPGIVICCDPGQLDSAIINLAVNAQDAMGGAGKLFLRIFRETRAEPVTADAQRPEFCIIEFEDTGPGVPQDIRHKIFEPFFSTKSIDGKGVGLGLAAVSGFVESFGGSIDVRTGRMGGALFVIRLPIAAQDTVGLPNDDAKHPKITGKHCLVLEDEQDLQDLTVLFLERIGLTSDAASSLQAAHDLLSRKGAKTYQLLLCDLQLPDGDGHQITEPFRRQNPTAPIIYVSGNAGSLKIGDGERALLLSKPYSYASLHDAVSKLLTAAPKDEEPTVPHRQNGGRIR